MLRFVVYGTEPRHGVIRLDDAHGVRRSSQTGRGSIEDADSSSATCPARPRSEAGGGARSELLYLIAVTDFKKTYFGTVLGYLWSLARPLMLFGGPARGLHAGLPIWPARPPLSGASCCSTSCCSASSRRRPVMAVGSIVGHEGGGPQDAVPAAGDPAVGGAHELVQPRAEPVVAFVFMLAFGVTPMWTWLLLPVVLLGCCS